MKAPAERWWTWPVQRGVLPPRAHYRAVAVPKRASGADTPVDRLDTLAEVASEAWAATNEDAILDAVGAGCARLGLNAHLAVADPAHACLIVRRVVLPAGREEVERILGGTALGQRIDVDLPTPYRRAFRDGVVERVVAPLLWVRLAVPALDQDEAVALARLIDLGAVALVPVAVEGATLGVLTVWASALCETDVSAARMLGRIAGGALAALRARR